jgi:DNA-binding MurR/RpiR family transcriptional regulator
VQYSVQNDLDDSIRSRIAGALGDLSPAQRVVAEYFGSGQPAVAVLTASEIAHRLGVSDATVVRTAQRLGFDGLPALRRSLVTHDQPSLVERLQHTLAQAPDAPNLLALSVQELLAAADVLLQQVARADLDRAVRILCDSDRILWSGVGPSAHLAGYACTIARRLGRDSDALTAAGLSAADDLLMVTAKTALVVLAYGRVHPHVRALFTRVQEMGAPVVLITDSLQGELGAQATETLICWRGAPALFASHAPTMALLEALLLGIAGADPNRAETALENLGNLRALVR